MARGLARALPAVVAGLTFAAFVPALDGEFVNWDDPANFLNNQGYRGLAWANLRWMFTTTLLGHYIPLTWLSLGVNYVVGGMDPWGYHLGSLLLHGLNAALFYLVARRLLMAALGSASPSSPAIALGALAAALVFGVHPLRVESVAWVTERRDVLCGLFYLLAVLAYLRGAERAAPLGGRWRWLSLAAFAGALLSKAIAMTLPLTLLLLDVYPLRRGGLGWRALLREKAGHVVLAAAGAAVAVVAVTRGAGWTGYEAYGPLARVAMVAYSFWFYPFSLLLPVDLSPLYELPDRVSVVDPRMAVPMAAFVLVSLALLLLRRRFPGGLAAWAHSAIVLAPVSGVVHAGNQLAHDRYSYLSGLGFAVLGGAAVAWVWARWEGGRLRPALAALALATGALAVLGWGAATWRQSHVWQSSEALWRAAIAADDTCAICHNHLGIAMVRSRIPLDVHRLAEAEGHFRRAIDLRPQRPDPYYNLGAVLARQRRHDEAEPILRTYRRLSPLDPEGPARIGLLYLERDRPAEAIPFLEEALRMNPSLPHVRSDLASALRRAESKRDASDPAAGVDAGRNR